MKALHKFSVVWAFALAAVVGIAYAAQPPHVVNSDVSGNTAMGTDALLNLTFGDYNTATGDTALYSNTTGSFNTATGVAALYDNTTGSHNIAIGGNALSGNTTGFGNTATGNFALYNNTEGSDNTASGSVALYSNKTGTRNVAVGFSALHDNRKGRSNTAIGWYAGLHTTGNDNIVIGHRGVTGESQTMRLGRQGTPNVVSTGVTRTFVAGVYAVTTSQAATPVMIDSKGQLGTISSSRRYKQDIQTMDDTSERLQKLRPVKFHYKQPDATGEHPIQYGLIAEEVAEVFPELVVNGEDGQPETVAYHLLPALLLNEVQRDHAVIEAQASHIAALEAQTAELTQLKKEFAEMAAVIEKLNQARMVATAN